MLTKQNESDSVDKNYITADEVLRGMAISLPKE